jgi:hypothetical protein
METLRYYFEDGTLVIFDKYTIDTNGVIRNKKTGKILKYFKTGEYKRCSVQDNVGKQRKLTTGRAIASTFHGKPPTIEHTADHIDKNPDNDTIDNIRWLDQTGQKNNRSIPVIFKSAFIIVKDGVEKTANEWSENLKEQKNHLNRYYTASMIKRYAQKKQHGFSYKEYPDIPGEVWKEIVGSENNKGGRWEISDMNRVKFVTKHAENVFTTERFCMSNIYPMIVINTRKWACHILSFMTFFPDKWAAKKPNEIVLHEDDDKLDFRPYKLRLGTRSENAIDAYDNDKSVRMKCVSYINGVFEKEHLSQSEAIVYLKSIGYDKACDGNICSAIMAHREGKILTRYDRTWQKM